MLERRRAKRIKMDSQLIIKRLDNGSNNITSIDVIDVSRTGVGFSCDEVLQIGSVYESFLTIWTKDVLHAFLRVVRIELRGERYFYGATFVGLPEMDASRIDVYQSFEEIPNN